MTEPSQKPFRTNYVLIDFENVRPDSLEQLDHEYFKLLVFVGASQGCVPYGMVTSLHRFGDRVEYIKISGNGSNALDFHIAYYIGKLAAADPTAYFHIISKDGGYDPLVQHLLAKSIVVRRVETISDIPLIKISNFKSALTERIEVVIGTLRQLKASKPARVKTLRSTIAALFPRLSDKEISSLIKTMAKNGYLTVSGTKITYAFE